MLAGDRYPIQLGDLIVGAGLVVMVVVARTGSEQADQQLPDATGPRSVDNLPPVVVMVGAAQRWAWPATANHHNRDLR